MNGFHVGVVGEFPVKWIYQNDATKELWRFCDV